MAPDALKNMLARIESWPETAQEAAMDSLQAIEDELRAPYQLTDGDRAAIERGLAAAARGDFASEAELQSLFARFSGE